MRTKYILILGAGGVPAINFTRSLVHSNLYEFFTFGTDCDKYNLRRAETDRKILIPGSNDPNYIPALKEIIREEKIDFIHAQNDKEIAVISEHREELETTYFLPSKETVKICQNKFESMKLWSEAKIPQPKILLIKNETDLSEAFKFLGHKLWLREISGAGAKGALATKEFSEAKAWINFQQGWGKFVAAEYLSPRSVTWQSIWKDGELIVAQSRERISWELGNHIPSGVSGATGVAMTVSDPIVDKIAEQSILAIDPKPNGIFSVDMTYDQKDEPVPTEINIARFFTTHYFFTVAGLNMPLIYIRLAFNEDYPKPPSKINPLQSDLLWIRGLDVLPILSNKEEVNQYDSKFKSSN